METHSPILACTDGSAHARNVYQYAAWASEQLATGVELLHVLDHHREEAGGTDLSGAIGFDASQDVTDELVKLEEAQGKLQRLKGKAVIEDGVEKLTALGVEKIIPSLRHGNLLDELERVETRTSLLVIGKNGQHAERARGHLGSNLQRVIKASKLPVLVTGSQYRPIRRFLIAYDGGPSITRAMDFLAKSPMLKGCECHLLRAGTIDDQARWYLGEAAAKLTGAGYPTISHAQPGRPEEIIPKLVKDYEIDLLVMGAYGHSPIRHLIMGSTTTSMLLAVEVPVLLFR